MNRTQTLIGELVRHGHFKSPDHCQAYFSLFLGDIPLAGKSVLEIGSGLGWMCLYAGCQDACRVVGLEPEAAGSTEAITSLKEFKRMIDLLGLEQIEASPCAIENYDSAGDGFDVILSRSSINHLDEDACRQLQTSETARDRYRSILKGINSLLTMGGTLVIGDASRYNLFATLGLKNPFAPTIEWGLHQSPYFWDELLKECGFSNPRINWLRPRRLDRLGVLVGNRFVAYCLRSSFRLVMTKSRTVS